jgi:ribonuclease HII
MGGPTYKHERALIAQGRLFVAGVDEVGRGPLAGPVGVGAVILDPRNLPKGLNDSKVLSAARREELAAAIYGSAIAVSLAFASVEEIDHFNIRGATLLAMRRAVAALSVKPQYALIDGCDTPPGLLCPAHPIVGGDGLSLSIAAASIVAKVARDALMARLDAIHPGYGFARHAGYATREHAAALTRLGPCPLHRRSFKPIALFDDDSALAAATVTTL